MKRYTGNLVIELEDQNTSYLGNRNINHTCIVVVSRKFEILH